MEGKNSIQIHYLPPPHILHWLHRPLHSGSTYARDLSKTKLKYIQLENLTCIDDKILYSCLTISFFYSFVAFILVCCSQREDNILRCNLLFGFGGYSDLLKDINIPFFLSFSISLPQVILDVQSDGSESRSGHHWYTETETVAEAEAEMERCSLSFLGVTPLGFQIDVHTYIYDS